MALNYKIIGNKPLLTTETGEQYIDLLGDVFTSAMSLEGEIFTVSKYYVARPDLVSFVCYGDDKYADIICKLNGISNPFELNEGDILYIPEENYLYNCMENNVPPSQLVSNKEIYNEISSRVLSSQKMKNEKRSPNEQVIGDTNLVIDKTTGIVLF